MTNILEAVVNIINYQNYDIKRSHFGRNRINSMGSALEAYIIDAFAGTFLHTDDITRNQIQNQKFSWLGSHNHPPDAMIRNGDAIEVKKTQNPNASLAFNSSYPKSTLRSDSTLIAKGCKECEAWTERDIIYAVGHTNDDIIKSLWFVYGNIYAADHRSYALIRNVIESGVNSIPNVEFAITNELAGVKKVDPLGITHLRIRGMWHIQNPRVVFNYLKLPIVPNKKFEMVCIIPESKYNSFPLESRKHIDDLAVMGFKKTNIQVKDPNNPSDWISCILITFCI